MSVQPPADLPTDWEDRRDELLAIWEAARHDNDEDLTPEQLCPNGPAELWAALAEDIECLKRFSSKFLGNGQRQDPSDRASLFVTEIYQGIEPIGEGGQGEVIRAKDVRLNRDVAVKQLKQHWIWNPSARQRLEREARITGKLEHPGVIPIYGFGHDREGKPFYAMRYLRGERTFEDAISDAHQIADTSAHAVAFRKLLRDFAAVCRTIDYAHSKGLIHRDIKPSNIMTGDYGEVLVVDWGLAKSLENDNSDDVTDNARETVATTSMALLTLGVAGTLSYMSPEQAEQSSLATKASDIYSLGATLYHVLTGRPAYEGDSVSELLAKVRGGDFVHPRIFRSGIPAALEAICVKAMSHAPAVRYPNASAMADDIDCWLADEPVSVWPDPIFERFRRWTKRNRALATSIAAGLLVAVLTLSVASIFLNAAWRREQTAKDELASANSTLVQQNIELRRPQYASQFQVARSLWQSLELDEATRVLNSMDRDLRGMEWYRLNAACQKPRQIGLSRKDDFVNSLGNPSIVASAISPDGSRVVVATRKQALLKQTFTWTIRMLNIEPSEVLWQRDSDRLVSSLRFDIDGDVILVEYEPLVAPIIGLDAALEIQWPTPPVRDPGTQPENADPRLAREPSDKSADNSNATPSTTEVWEAMFGKTLSNRPTDFVVNDPSSSYIVERVASEEGIRLPVGGDRVPQVQVIRFHLTEQDAPGSAYRIDSTLVIPADSAVTLAAIDSTNRIAATAHEDGAIRLWTVPSSHPLGQIPAMATKVLQLVFDKDTKSLRWLATQPVEQGSIACFAADLSNFVVLPERVAQWPEMQFFNSFTTSDDRRSVAILDWDSDPTLTVWDLASAKLKHRFAIETISGPPSEVQFCLNHDGTLVAVASREQSDQPSLRVYDVASGQPLWTDRRFGSPITFKGSGVGLFACRLGTAEIAMLDGNSGKVSDEISTGSGRVEIDGQPLAIPPEPGLLSYHAPTDQLIVFPRISDEPLKRKNTDGQLLAMDLPKRAGRYIPCPSGDRYRGVRQVRYSRDGKTAIVIHHDSNFAQLWDVANWRVTAVLDGHRQTVTNGLFSVDQNRVVTASLDGTVKLWDAKTGNLFWTFVTLSYPQFVAFGNDDRELVAGSREGIQRWLAE